METPDAPRHSVRANLGAHHGIQIPLGPVRTVRDVTALVRQTLDDPTARAHDHEWLCPIRAIWRALEPPITKQTTKKHVRAAKTLRGRRENAARERRLKEEDDCIGSALQERTWGDIDKLQATTSRQRLRLRRMKGDRISGWDRLHEQRGCPHCVSARDGGSLSHIFWSCPSAQALWDVLLRGWEHLNIWRDEQSVHEQLKQAVFQLRLPRFPGRLWQLHDLATIPSTDVDSIAALHDTARTAWQQLVLEVFDVVWKWRHNVENGKQLWTTTQATSYLTSSLRSTLRGLHDRLPRAPTLRDSRRQLLSALARQYDREDDSAEPRTPSQPGETHVLFFDGGSRGNPGPGGAGAVLVSADRDAMNPRVDWSGCMSYAQADMTNNRAEYMGVITGLREAKERGWKVDVVGDSNLILRQLADYRPPRNAKLRPLYCEARRLADQVRVDVWQHHLRAFNKMADAAANAAMDLRSSVQVDHPSEWNHTTTIDRFLRSDFQEWHTRHILRAAQD